MISKFLYGFIILLVYFLLAASLAISGRFMSAETAME